MRFKYFYFIFSGIFLIPSILSLIFWGLKPSVEFTGGTDAAFEIRNAKFETERIATTAKEVGIEVSAVNAISGNPNGFILKSKEIPQEKYIQFQSKIKEAGGEVKELYFEFVGPVIGKELVEKTIIAILIASFFIMIYVARQFKDKMYGVCAVIAMFHDTIIVLGVFSMLSYILNVEVDLLFVTAVLTILSFSVHDTVVVYDRIRESVRTAKGLSFEDLVNKAVGETLSRSINNSMTIIFMLLSLFLLGGETIRWFVLALLIGTISGTYSSTFTASPLLIVWEKLITKRAKA